MVRLRSMRLFRGIRARFTHDLSAPRQSGQVREIVKILLVMHLPAPPQWHKHNARARLRSRAVADFAKLQAWNTDFGVHTRSRFLEAQFHIVTKISAAVRAVRPRRPPKIS